MSFLPTLPSLTGPDQILSQQATAGLLRPAYVLIKDEELKMIVLCIRGTQSMKDLFTSLTGECTTLFAHSHARSPAWQPQ
jgi:hypothetical protein